MTPKDKEFRTKMSQDWVVKRGAVITSAQRDFNLMIRLEAADDNGWLNCVVTGKPFRYTEVDAGHFISATRAATRYDERNVHPQSAGSNRFDTTNNSLIYYTMFMLEKYGRETVDELLTLSKTKKKWEFEELYQLRVGWRERIKREKKRIQ